MKVLNVLRKTAMLRFSIGFLILGVLFAFLGGLGTFRPQGEYLQTEAVISEIQKELDPTTDGEYLYHTFVDYTVDGVDYTHVEFGSYSSSMHEGDTVTIEYNVDDPSRIQSKGAKFIPPLFFVLGILLAGFGVFSLVKNARRPSESFEEYNRADASAASPEEIAAIRDSIEPQSRYYFRFNREFLKQGHVMEDEYKSTVYEAKMLRWGAMADNYLFCNASTGEQTEKKIGHTVSVSDHAGVGVGFSFATPISAHFTIDGVKNWDVLSGMGFGFSFRMEGIRPCFDILHYGVKVGEIETAGTDPTKDGENKPRFELPVNGMFRISCRASDIEAVFLICMSITRAIFYAN